MSVKSPAKLEALLRREGITQVELARGTGRSEALISRVIRGAADPSKDTIDAILTFLNARLGRRVTYERVFGEERAA
jgi:predicted transcriptional regulator